MNCQMDSSFDPKQMFKLMDKRITILYEMNQIELSAREETHNGIYRLWDKSEYLIKKLIFLFLNPNICCWYLKEPSRWDGSFDHPKQMFKLMDSKIITILC